MRGRLFENRGEAQSMPAVRIAGLLFTFLTAGCAGLEQVPAGDPGRRDATPSAASAPVATTATSTDAPPQVAATPDAAIAPAPKATSSVPRSIGQPAAKATSPAATAPAKAPTSPAPTGQLSKKDSTAPALTKSDAPPPLDMKSLETRLKETNAIGVFTKLALKNQVDDLLNQFRAFYAGRLKTTLAALRRPYEMLLLKVLALLQDSDPPLAGAIVASREAIWGILADPAKFASI